MKITYCFEFELIEKSRAITSQLKAQLHFRTGNILFCEQNFSAQKLVKMASFMEDLRNELICDICQDGARPGKKQWYRCMRLHQICQDCKAKTFLCSCGQPISIEFCKMTEKWLSVKNLKFNCGNTKYGCREILTESALEDHESECIYRLVPCPYAWKNGCRAQVSLHDVIRHYENMHSPIEKVHVEKDSEVIEMSFGDPFASGDDCLWRPSQHLFDNRMMFLMFRRTESTIFQHWLYLLGSPMEAKHFSYTLKFIGPKTTLTFEGQVAAIDETFENLSRAGKCFGIPHDQFMAQFVGEDPKYKYSLEIRNLKEEAKDENYESGVSDSEDSKE